MAYEESQYLIRINESCPNKHCLMKRYNYHSVEMYNLCTHCGWKEPTKYFLPDAYSGSDWDDENKCFTTTQDNNTTPTTK